MSFKLPTKEEKHFYVHEQFERIARGYDLSNDVISLAMHRAWKMRAVGQLLSGAKGGKYLDVCCGTGDVTLVIARQAASDAKSTEITGLDFSQNMLDLAGVRQHKLARRKHEISSVKIDWICGDAQNLPFADNTFDGAIISFGLRNLTDLQRGLNEMARVVKAGGRVVNLDLGHTSVPIFAPIFDAYFSKVVPVIGAIIQNDKSAYTYLPESGRNYPRPERITAMFEAAGLSGIRHTPLSLGTVALHMGVKR